MLQAITNELHTAGLSTQQGLEAWSRLCQQLANHGLATVVVDQVAGKVSELLYKVRSEEYQWGHDVPVGT